MNKDKGYKRVGRIYKTVDKDKGNEERIFKTPDEDQKKEEKFHKRGEEDGANGERICNIMKKEEGIELDGLVKKMDTKNSQNICNKRKQPSEDMLEMRRKKKRKIVTTREKNIVKMKTKLIITRK